MAKNESDNICIRLSTTEELRDDTQHHGDHRHLSSRLSESDEGECVGNIEGEYVINDNNFEIWGSLGRNLSTEDEQVNAQPGDVVLYSGQYICIFYGSNPYNYTRLGRIEGLSESELRTFLKAGESNIRATLSQTSGSTDIQKINNRKKQEESFYSMNGVKVKNPSQGLFIKNNKKIVL